MDYMYDYIYLQCVTYVVLLCSSVMNTTLLSLVLEKFGDSAMGASQQSPPSRGPARYQRKCDMFCVAMPGRVIRFQHGCRQCNAHCR